MGLIPQRVKDMLTRRSTTERMNATVMTTAESLRWDAAHKDGEQKKLFDLAQSILKTGKLTKEQRAQMQEFMTSEAVAPQLFTLTTGDGEDPGFRRITSLATLRDLNPLMHDRMLQVCYFLRVTTPFGKRIVEILTDYTIGKGVRITAKDPRVQDVIDDFWDDEVNNMDDNVEQWSDELTTFGEECIPVAVNPVSGQVRVGYIDPMNIDTIQFAEMATANGTASINVPYAVRLRREVGEVLQKPMQLVRRIEDVNSPAFGFLDGECFYFTLNKAKSASRGFSELFALADWIDLFDQMIFDFGDKVRFLNQFIWHYTVNGADNTKVKEFKDSLTKDPPKQGGMLVTNEQVKAEPLTPDFKGSDMNDGSSMVKKYGLGGAGIPPVLMGDGDDANRAASLEMNAPFVKKIQKRQNHLGRCLTQVLTFQIEWAQRVGALPKGIDTSFAIEFPEIVVKDLAKGASTLTGVATAVQTAQEEGWITGATAARAVHTVMSEIGVDIPDTAEEYKNAQDEKKQRDADKQAQFYDQGRLAAALNAKTPNGNGDAAGEGPDAEMINDADAKEPE